MKNTPIVARLLFTALFVPWLSAFAGVGPVVESIEGAKSVKVVSSSKKAAKSVSIGEELAVGNKIRTDSKVSLRLLYPDQTQLLVGRGSEVVVQEKTGNSHAAMLNFGQVRAKVAQVNANAPKGAYRFVIRSKSAVMGVRGTDFVVETTDKKGEKVETHTLDGTVEVAKDDKSLQKGEGVPVEKNQFIKADPRQIAKPAPFDPTKYMSALQKKQPDFNGMIQRPPKTSEELRQIHSKTVDDGKAKVEQAKKIEEASKGDVARKAEEAKKAAPAAPQIERPAAPPAPAVPPPPPAPALPKPKSPFGR